MNILLSWTITVGVVGAVVWHSCGRPNLLEKYIPSSKETAQGASGTKSKNRRRTKRPATEKDAAELNLDGASSASATGAQEAGKPTNKKRKINTTASKETPKVDLGVTSSSDRDDEGLSNQQFARQLAQAKTGAFGASLQPAKNKVVGNKGMPSPSLSAGASSTTGADADDDRSPSVSPELPPADASGVSDMLEPRAASAGVLRITGEAPAPKTSRGAARPAQSVETKKQRQQKKKNEERKKIVAEAERQRLELQEKQLRAARTAEGTSKQQAANSFKPQQNAWTTISKSSAPSVPKLPDFQPLDTYDEPSNGLGINGATSSKTFPETSTAESSFEVISKPVESADWTRNVPSEEDQIQQLLEQDQDAQWNTVSIKKKKAGKVGSEKENSEASGGAEQARIQNATNAGAKGSSRPGVTAANSYGVLKNEGE